MVSFIEVRRSGIHGRGVFATQRIPKGKRIIEYKGQRIADADAPDDDGSSHTFNFGLSNGKVIDPVVGGNDARWINHSCEPNCEALEERGRIFIYAKRTIKPGEELFYDYSLEIDEPITEETKKQYECLCGDEDCRGTMLGGN
jgi:SET domain-containing protein